MKSQRSLPQVKGYRQARTGEVSIVECGSFAGMERK